MKTVFIGDDSQTSEFVGVSIRMRWPDEAPIVAISAREGMELIESTSPSIVILHPSFTDATLTEAIKELRSFCPDTPLMVLSQMGDQSELVNALELGADDYVKLPCPAIELIARVGALSRRATAMTFLDTEMPIRSGELLVDPVAYDAFMGSHKLELTSTEFRMLYLLVKNRGSLVSHEKIELTIWGDRDRNTGLSTKYVQRLRRKMGDTAQDPNWLASIQGVGYRFTGPKLEVLTPSVRASQA